MIPDGAVDEFANTFKEWHYFVGGGAIGFVLGFIVALLWTIAHEEVTD